MPKREYIGKGAAPARADGWNSDEFHTHIRGRADATIQVLVGVAVLKRHGLLPGALKVSVTGARWQDWKGTRESPRAHRFPCNPQVGGRDLPLLATGSLRALLQQPLAATDYLPLQVNYADRLFEELGGIEAARRAVEYVASRQAADQPVDQSLITTAWRTIAWTGYVNAYDTVERHLLDRVNRENTIRLLERIAGYRPNAPTDNIESVQDVVVDALQSTRAVSAPPLLSVPGMNKWAGSLEAAAPP